MSQLNPTQFLDISIPEQRCVLKSGDNDLFSAPVSTALNGPGELCGSGCTPRGWHQVRACIGHKQVENMVFVGRRPTGEIYSPSLAEAYPDRDWILTRIIWLSGLEPGKNRFGNVDTMRRYIYIHGCPQNLPMGEPLSHGCIRMHNKDLLTLFDLIKPGLKVLIHE